SERPVASPLARRQAATDAPVTSLRHRLVTLSEFDRVILRHLDGTRDRAALLGVLLELAATSQLTIASEQKPQTPAQVREYLDAALTVSLQRLAFSALLVA